MRIFNKKRDTVIADDALEAKNIKDKTLGLLKYKTQRALILKTRFGIHTFGMKKPIDVVILDSKHKVVSMKENLMPWSVFCWNPKYEIVIELPRGVIGKTHTQIGDRLEFIE